MIILFIEAFCKKYVTNDEEIWKEDHKEYPNAFNSRLLKWN